MISSTRGTATGLSIGGIVLVMLGVGLWSQPAVEIGLYHALHLAAPFAATRPVKILSDFGSFAFVASLAVFGAIGLFAQGRRDDAIWVMLTFACGRLALLLLKMLVHRPRPPLAWRLQHVTSWSFPSTHAADSLLVFLLLAIAFGRRPIGLGLAIAGSVAIGWSRVALGVHWPSDVLAGWGSACLILALALAVRRHRGIGRTSG